MSAFKGLKPILYGGREVWPLVEGGKGVAATNHTSSGAWAAALALFCGALAPVWAMAVPAVANARTENSRNVCRNEVISTPKCLR